MRHTPFTCLLAASFVLGGCTDAATGVSDTIAPTVSITSPVQGTLDLLGGLVITADASDDVGITLVQFDVDGALVSQDDSAPYASSTIAVLNYAAGAHVLRVRARDAAGNWSAWASVTVTFGGAASLPVGFTRVPFATGFGSLLTALAVAPDGRLFVTEIGGAIRVVRDGILQSQPFASVAALTGGERGLLGIALAPGFGATGYVYVYYTTSENGAHNRISRFAAFGDAAGSTEEVLVNLPALSAATNHNGGAIQFGPDGKLYVAVGDNASGSLAPALTSPFGKILRFNADGTIPSDNPFFGQTTGVNRSIWARGLRNPYTFAFQPGTGRMHINDVGQSSWEEINLGRAGADYGWPSTEGPTTNAAFDAPLLAYGRSGSPTLFNGASVIGAAFYNPPTALFGAGYVGDYFFADYVAGWIYRLDLDNENRAYAFARTGGNPTGLAVGLDGALYVLLGTRVDRIAR